MKMLLLFFSLFFFSQLGSSFLHSAKNERGRGKDRKKQDSDALGEERITVSPGETATFSCTYRGDSTKLPKFFCKWDDEHCKEVIRTSDSQRRRFSISEDSSRSTATVRISNVRKEDRGVYSCGGWRDSGKKSEDHIFTNRFNLHVTGRTPPVKKTTPKIPTAANPGSSSTPTSGTTYKESPSTPLPNSSAVAITTCICVVLLLIGGLTFVFYKLRHSKTRGAAGNNDEVPSNPPVPGICSTEPQPESSTQSVKYITVNFKKNPLNPTDPPSEPIKEKSTTQYVTVKYNTHQK